MGAKKPKKAKPTEYEKALAEVATKKNQIYKENFFPVEDRLIAEAGKDRSAILRKRTIGTVAAASGAAGNAGVEQASVAIDPSSGKFLDTVAGFGTSGATIAAEAATKASVAANERQTALRANLGNFGSGLAGDAQSSLERLAASATNLAISKNDAKYRADESIRGSIGQVAGSAIGFGIRQRGRVNSQEDFFNAQSVPTRGNGVFDAAPFGFPGG